MATDIKTQMIDYDGNIIGDLKNWMIKHKLSNLGFDYNVLAILGSQSSGKSTLLNNLFRTTFDVMDTKKGHSQTTKGLWISYGNFESDEMVDGGLVDNDLDRNYQMNGTGEFKKGSEQCKANPTLIIDVEGTDSKERGDNRLTFEHRSALLCLALADCVIVNLWYHSLGNFTASNYGLLKTVMEVNLELFQQDVNCPKTILLFTVRDWFEDLAPLEVIKNKILEDYLYRIWKEIKKSDAVENLDINNFFTIEVVGLSHAIITKEKFERDIIRLRSKWVHELRPTQYSRNIPSDGFAQYCNNIWNTIIKQSQLDIPSQKEMLATFRCQEIKNNVLSNISKTIKEKFDLSQHKVIDNFKEWAEHDVIEKCLNEYLADACRYKESICLKTVEELLEGLYVQLQSIVDNNLNYAQRILSSKFSTQLNNMYQICSKDKAIFVFQKQQEEILHMDGELVKQENFQNSEEKCIYLWNHFLYNMDHLESEILSLFSEEFKKCIIKIRKGELHEFNYKPTLNTLSTSILKDGSQIKNAQYALLINKIRNTISQKLKFIDGLLVDTKDEENFWKHVKETADKLQEQISDHLSLCLINLRNKEIEKDLYHTSDTNMLGEDKMKSKGKDEAFHTFGISCDNNDHAAKFLLIKNNKPVTSKVQEEIEKKLNNAEVKNEIQTFFREQISHMLQKKIQDIIENLSSILVQRFELAFNYDEAEQPRQWKNMSATELKKLFRDSKNYAFLIIDLIIKEVQIDSFVVSVDKNFAKEELIEKAKNKAKKKMQEICRDAQYIQATGGTIGLKNIPFLFWIILLIFGWNEIVSFFRFFFNFNIILPLILTVLFIASACVYSGNTQIISYINKIVFYFAKNSYNVYRNIQEVTKKTEPVDSD